MSNNTSNVNAQNLITSFKYPEDVDVDPSGNVFLADTDNNSIQKYSNSGTYITTWGSYGTGNGKFIVPAGIAVDPSGNVFIADTDNNRIQKFSNSGTFITKFGSFGTDNGCCEV